MDRKFIYFINPISGTGGKAFLTKIIKNKTSEKNISFEILHTNATGEYAWLKEKITTEKITDIIICGGDGTVSQVYSPVAFVCSISKGIFFSAVLFLMIFVKKALPPVPEMGLIK